jgi:hypothetical protein
MPCHDEGTLLMNATTIPLAVGLLLVAAAFAWSARVDLFRAAVVWLGLLLFHELALRWLVNLAAAPPQVVSMASLWKEAGLAGLLFGAGIEAWPVGRPPTLSAPDWAVLLFVLVGLAAAALSPNKLAGLAALRDYFEPVLLYGIGRFVRPTERQVARWQKAWMLLATVMAALAIWQGIAWNASDYARFGFGEVSGQIGIPRLVTDGESLIRPPSTLTGPNELALHMVLGVSLAASLFLEASRRYWYAAGAAVLAAGALVLTASRSGFLGLVVALAFVTWHAVRQRMRGRLAPFGRRSVLLAVVVVLVVAVPAIWLTGFGSLLARTVGSLGRQYHVVDTLDALRFLVSHPAGVGMGLVGPRQGFGFPTVAAFHVEGSLLQIAMEMGVWGLGVYLALMLISLRRAWFKVAALSSAVMRVSSIAAVAGWAGALVALVFLPLMQALPLMAWLWFLLGLACSADRIETSWGAGVRLSPQAAPTMPRP